MGNNSYINTTKGITNIQPRIFFARYMSSIMLNSKEAPKQVAAENILPENKLTGANKNADIAPKGIGKMQSVTVKCFALFIK